MTSEHRIGQRVLAAVAVTIVLACAPRPARAVDTSYPSDGDHPLRVAHYFVAPAGGLLEWTVMRPLAVVGRILAPYQHIDAKTFRGCSRERPARSCTNVVK